MFIKQVATRGLVFKIEINKSRNVFNKRVDKQNTIQGVKSICGQDVSRSCQVLKGNDILCIEENLVISAFVT